MKRFVGGNDGRVFVVNPGIRELGTFEWGVKPLSAKCADLAKALLMELLQDPQRMHALYMRFMHRTIAEWKPMVPWTKTEDELRAVVKDIDQTERETATLRAQMARELPVIHMEPQLPGETGYGGRDSAPDRRGRK